MGAPGSKAIVFFTDGAANTGPRYLDASPTNCDKNTCTTPYVTKPCNQGVTSAATIKATGTLIYSMGYDLTAGTANICQTNTYKKNAQGQLTTTQNNESPAITATSAIQQIASGPSYFYNQPSASQVNTLFAALGANLLAGTANLVDNNTP